MVFRCVVPFETGEDGYQKKIHQGTVWIANYKPNYFGGYELAKMERVARDGSLTGETATVRLSRLSTNYELLAAADVRRPDCLLI